LAARVGQKKADREFLEVPAGFMLPESRAAITGFARVIPVPIRHLELVSVLLVCQARQK
jgi:hypothetical protein